MLKLIISTRNKHVMKFKTSKKLGTIKQPVCRKMCSKNFENWLTNKEFLVKNIFE